jgi:hypothetical protein
LTCYNCAFTAPYLHSHYYPLYGKIVRTRDHVHILRNISSSIASGRGTGDGNTSDIGDGLSALTSQYDINQAIHALIHAIQHSVAMELLSFSSDKNQSTIVEGTAMAYDAR